MVSVIMTLPPDLGLCYETKTLVVHLVEQHASGNQKYMYLFYWPGAILFYHVLNSSLALYLNLSCPIFKGD